MIIIGIAGASGSGKSLFAKTIVSELGSNLVQVLTEDRYYKDNSNIPLKERENINYDHPNAFDHNLLKKHLLDLKNGKAISVPNYDYSTHTRTNKTDFVCPKTKIIVLEGILIFHSYEIRKLLNMKIFMDTPFDLCIIRRILRDTKERMRTVESVINQYLTTVRPMFLQFVEPSKIYADIILPNGGKNRIAIDIVKTKISSIIEKK